ncbi:chromate transporter [Aliiroseovarius sp. N1F302]|uniref:chromate transporter n=1 Tax=Aliiroseovarius sediminis TaxID=2925839 RepID=UPI001F5A57D6|nr:chromate transporter [Aliiroseovarius sediminis]
MTPIALAVALEADILAEIGAFCSKLAVVSFGGAYGVLAYMTQVVVTTQNWLTPDQMMDGLDLRKQHPVR